MEDRDKTITISHEEAMGFITTLNMLSDKIFTRYPELLPREEFFSGYEGMKKQVEVLMPGESLVLDISGSFAVAYLIQIVFSMVRQQEEQSKESGSALLPDQKQMLEYFQSNWDDAKNILLRISETYENNEPMLKVLEDIFDINTGRARRLTTDNTESIVTIHANESNQLLYSFLFNVWDYIMLSADESKFAGKLRKNPLLHLADFEEVKTKMSQLSTQHTVMLTLRDSIVMYWIFEITCRMFSTDAGDLLEEVAGGVVAETGITYEALRSFIIKNTSAFMQELQEKMIEYPLFYEYANQAHEVEWE